MKRHERRASLTAGIAAVLYGLACYVGFLATLVYTIGFVGNLGMPKTIDSGSPGSIVASILVDVLLLVVFAVQHSVMARPAFKRVWTRVVPRSIERSTYVLCSSAALAFVCWQWRPLPEHVWTVRQPFAVAALHGTFWLAWVMLVVSTGLLSHFELFGVRQVLARLGERALPEPKFSAPAFYRYVRHPIYLCFLTAFWSTPTMSAGRLLFALVMTGYVLAAIQLEERDLIAMFGNQYRSYRRRVPMLLPLGDLDRGDREREPNVGITLFYDWRG